MNAPLSSPLSTTTWARARLRLGQANVGTWVLAATWCLWSRPDAGTPSGPWSVEAAGWAGLVVLWTLLQLPFDVVGGYVQPVRHGRRAPGFAAWLSEWARGVSVHGSVLVVVGWAVLAAAQAGGSAAAGAVVAVAMLAQVAGQELLLRASTSLQDTPWSPAARAALARADLDPDATDCVAAHDTSFVGGWLGLPGRERLIVPARWANRPPMLEVIGRRRSWALTSHARARGMWGAFVFQLVGWTAVVLLLPDVRLDTALGLGVVTAGVTLWGFLGLLTLPSLSRRAVHDLDRAAARALGPVVVSAAIRELDRDQEDEDDDARGPWTSVIFHPVPTPSRRIQALTEPPDDGLPSWRITRTALFLGWSTGSWLSRAVHCNVGRPALWVVLPGD